MEAERLFWKYGVRSVTMDDIARQLGISKKTIYQHFGDKEDILQQVVQTKSEQNQAEVHCMAVEADNPVEEILVVLDMMRKHADQVSPNLLIDIQRHYPKAFAVYRQHKETYIMRSILENIQKGIEQGLYRSDLKADILARMRVEQIEQAFNNDIYPADRYSMFDIQQELMHHFVRGMLTEKGFTIYNQSIHKAKRIQSEA